MTFCEFLANKMVKVHANVQKYEHNYEEVSIS